jgi:hypothetical protein
MVDVSAGSASVNGSEVYCWGSVAGSGTPKSMNFPSGPNYVRATTGAMHACANFPNTAMMCIGLNNFGQFGDGTNNSSWSGTMGAGGMGYSILAASSMFMCGTTCSAAKCSAGAATSAARSATARRRIPTCPSGPEYRWASRKQSAPASTTPARSARTAPFSAGGTIRMVNSVTGSAPRPGRGFLGRSLLGGCCRESCAAGGLLNRRPESHVRLTGRPSRQRSNRRSHRPCSNTPAPRSSTCPARGFRSRTS